MTTRPLARIAGVALALAWAPWFAHAEQDESPPSSVPTSPDPAEPEPAPADDTQDSVAAVDDDDTGGIEIIHIVSRKDNVVPGSAQALDEEELERFESDDPHRVFSRFAGVYIREEEGYGNRPNIGMRGSGSERSAKIALMEDGVLIAPAPYSAPAAYYFPLITRMARVEVLKGPASVQHGPNTVGGALNMVSRPVGRDRETTLDAALGSELYGKLHATHTESSEHFGLLVDGIKLRTDGFKELDGGGDTGFDKNAVLIKARANTSIKANTYHEFGLKLGYSDEDSNETYTGLTDADFAANPDRRYRATQLDRLEWRHLQILLSHKVEVGADFVLLTQAYRHDFDRSWRKLNSFGPGANTLADVLANPTAGNNAVLYSILTGDSDSSSASDGLVIGTNERRFVSQGLQSAATVRRPLLGFDHELSAGARLHYDRVTRYHTEESMLMSQGNLVGGGMPAALTRDTVGTALATSVFAQNAATRDKFTVTAGARVETVSIEHDDFLDPATSDDDRYTVVIPGGGLFYKVLPELGVLAGVHRGFVPVAPGQNDGIDPESSTNYELGTRFGGAAGQGEYRGELVGFFSDYSNLKGTCTFAVGCRDMQVDDEFNGGDVHVLGVEASASAELLFGKLAFPLRGSYTFTRSRFQSSFSSSNPQWGDVESGDEIPYLPAHQLAVTLGVTGKVFGAHTYDVALAGRFTSSMRDTAGQGDTAAAERTDASTVVDVAASYAIPNLGKAYLTLSNALGQRHIVSRRPFGARPGQPRTIIVGYKNSL